MSIKNYPYLVCGLLLLLSNIGHRMRRIWGGNKKVKINLFIFIIIVGNHSCIFSDVNQLSCKNVHKCVQHWLSITNVTGCKSM